MESLAARTADGTFTLAIGRGKLGKVGQLELHLSLTPGEETSDLRQVLGGVSDLFQGQRARTDEGTGDLLSRLNALISELADQDEAAEVPSSAPTAAPGKGQATKGGGHAKRL